MKNKLLYSLIAGAVVMTGLSSCDNEEFLNVTHYSILEMSTMYESDANAKAALNGCYDLMLPSNTAGHNGDPFKPYLFTGSHPTMDSQATGWDKAFMTQSWNAQTTELSAGWNQAYAAITRSNDFLSGSTCPPRLPVRLVSHHIRPCTDAFYRRELYKYTDESPCRNLRGNVGLHH